MNRAATTTTMAKKNQESGAIREKYTTDSAYEQYFDTLRECQRTPEIGEGSQVEQNRWLMT